MSESIRLYRYQKLLSAHRAMPARDLASALEISHATLKRDLTKLRDQLGMPIVFDRESGGYRLTGKERIEIPGMWLRKEELLAFMILLQLTAPLQNGLLENNLAALKNRLVELLQHHGLDTQVLVERLMLSRSGLRTPDPQALSSTMLATVQRRKMKVCHVARQTQARVERIVSPQRIALHQGNWHLDAWCHLRGAMRSFVVASFETHEILDEPALEVPKQTLDAAGFDGYGSFYGSTLAWARLRFAPHRARDVAREQWHRHQKGEMQRDGSYDLRIPYYQDRELARDIMRHGPDVQVIEPRSLRAKVQALHLAAAAGYVDTA